ncbi:isochorismatase family cysteine hydrolase [Collinsella sp. An2]|uniref:cysteine hydrolase family protein n=1 Tax=Collinsella sp. An2 TaxID=1965585 RepID=UPI000B38F04B|nr:isochorismatase family cysteine hydrolase [Collinsella sp. An2]OUP09831.1 amidase [Collinsella sp. An2]
MGTRYLVVIDMQNDFVDGALGTLEAQAIAAAVVAAARDFDGEVVFTLDTHDEDYLSTQEGSNLPVPHCIRGTEGWQLIPALEAVREERHAQTFEKPTFGSTDLAAWLVAQNAASPIESIEFIGVCTDICVVSNALLVKAALPEVPLSVDASLCAGVTPAAHEAALATMASCQVHILGRDS